MNDYCNQLSTHQYSKAIKLIEKNKLLNKKRNQLLSRSKLISFIEMNSMNLCNFEEDTYDLIWIDGAHGYPVVACDIINSYRLLDNNGIAMIDDVV